MDSVISKAQLDVLLANMQNSIPTNKVLTSLEQTYKLGTHEKQSFYHGILEIVKNTNEPTDIAVAVLEAVESVLKEKAASMAYEMEISVNGGESSKQPTGSTKQSPIFRRVG